MRTLALNDVGLVRLDSFLVILPPIGLSPVLEASYPGDMDELHAVYLGQGWLPPLGIRVLIEFLTQPIKISDP